MVEGKEGGTRKSRKDEIELRSEAPRKKYEYVFITRAYQEETIKNV